MGRRPSASDATGTRGSLPSADHTLAGDSAPGSAGPRRAGDPLPDGTVVGRFVVLSVLGSGGMGVVHLAFDPELDRKVALKLLRGVGGPSGAARMVLEARALASLNHPNVVAVYDVGTFDEDVWIAMEFIEGATLKRWSRERRRSWREVLEVMTAAGRGLAAAHAAGIVHRDLKPDNVMIGASDGRVRVMDFGLATATAVGDSVPSGGHGTAANDRTAVAVRGTPGYMAPEQHHADLGEPRMDQFAFCITLWEALYGERPFAGETWAELVFAISSGRIREPSQRAQVPRWLRRIVERGLATDPNRRWPTMDALLAALRRGQARAGAKWVAAAIGASALATLGVLALRELAHARAVRACADEAAAIAELWPGPQEAVAERMRAAFLASGEPYAEDAFRRVAPSLDAWTDTWREIAASECTVALEPHDARRHEAVVGCLAERRVGFGAVVAVLVDADALAVKKSVPVTAGLTGAEICRDETLLFARPMLPPSLVPADALEQRLQLERVRSLRITGRVVQALELAEASVAETEACGWMPLVAEARLELGRCRERSGDPQGAAAEMETAYLLALAHAHDKIALDAASTLVRVVGVSLDRPADGRRWGEQARAMLERLGESESLRAAGLDMNLGMIARAQGATDEARTRFEHAVSVRDRLLAPDDPDRAAAIGNLANVYIGHGDNARAIELYERVLAILETTLGPEHPDTLTAMNNLGSAQFGLERFAIAEGLMRRALELQERNLGATHPDVAISLHNLAEIAARRGDWTQAAELSERSVTIAEQALGPDHSDLAVYLAELGEMRMMTGRHDDAAQLFARATAIHERKHGPDHPLVARLLMRIAELDRVRGDFAAARESLARALAIMQREYGPGHGESASVQRQLGTVELSAGNPERAEALCSEALADLERASDGERRDGVAARLCLAQARLVLAPSAATIAAADRVLAMAEDRQLPEIATAPLHFALAQASGPADRDRSLDLARRAARAFAPSDPGAAAAADAWMRGR